MSYPKPKVGDTFFVVDAGNSKRYGGKRIATVTKVGRKYFTLNGDGMYSRRGGVMFHIATRREKTEFMSDYAVYETEQEYKDEIEKSEWFSAIRKSFDYWRRSEFTLEQLREAGKVLGIELEAEEK